MRSEINDLGGIKRRGIITIDKMVVDAETEAFIVKASKEVTVRGYRKGAAPASVVKNQMGDLINAEVTARLVFTAISDFVRDYDQKIAGLPVVIEEDRPNLGRRYVGEFNVDGTLTFRVDFELEPSLSVSNYMGLEVSCAKPDTEAWTNRALTGVRDQFANLVPVDGPAIDGHQLTLEFDEDGEISTLILGPELDSQVYDALKGKNAGDKFNISGASSGTLHSIDARELPDLNDELAQLAGFEGLEQLKYDLSLRAEGEYAQPLKAKLIEELTDQLVQANVFDVPAIWIDNEVKVTANRFGLKELPKLESELNSLRELCERSVRRSFILDKIYDAEESIHLSTDDLYTLTQVEASRQKVDVETYLTHLKNNNSYEAFVSFHEQIRAVDFLINSSVVKEQ